MYNLFNNYQSTRIYLALGTFSTILAGFTHIFLKKKLKTIARSLLLIIIITSLFSSYLFYKYNFKNEKRKLGEYTIRFQEYFSILYTLILTILLVIYLSTTFY